MMSHTTVPSHADAPVPDDPVDQVIRYHLRTKHHFNRYARSLGFLDWANQPDPFRRFEGAPLSRLPLLSPEDEPVAPPYDALYAPEGTAPQPLTIRSLSRFFEYALALSAWKRAGESEWALRSNPSSGNLHPTEGYLALPSCPGLPLGPGLYHYAPKEHALELRVAYDPEVIRRLLAPFPPGAFLVGLTSVHWREAWKYGERAYRYCQHDVGHAIGTLRIGAAVLGWRLVLLDGMEQHSVAQLLGTHRADDFRAVEPEHPDVVAAVWPARSEQRPMSGVPLSLDEALVTALAAAEWHGQANRLSRDHAVHWDVIEETAQASWKRPREHTTAPAPAVVGHSAPGSWTGGPDAGTIIRRRRSAVAFDGQTSITAAAFYRMLARVLPDVGRPLLDRPMPWDTWPYDPAVHLLLFVHRVDGLTPGIYFLLRDPARLQAVQQVMNPEIVWTPPPGAPSALPLYWLLEGDARRLASQVSCHQDIAGDSAFSLGMIAEFEGRLRERGGWWYPRLFWECGLIGQVLYLEAEAAGVRATGIGCFFDDPVHEIVGITDLRLQSLYHFTVGGPVEDRRLMTLPAYHHLQT